MLLNTPKQKGGREPRYDTAMNRHVYLALMPDQAEHVALCAEKLGLNRSDYLRWLVERAAEQNPIERATAIPHRGGWRHKGAPLKYGTGLGREHRYHVRLLPNIADWVEARAHELDLDGSADLVRLLVVEHMASCGD